MKIKRKGEDADEIKRISSLVQAYQTYQQLLIENYINTSIIDYKTLSNVVESADKSRFIDIFEKRVYEEDINEIVLIKDTNNTKRYINIVAKRWESSIYGDEYIIGIFKM